MVNFKDIFNRLRTDFGRENSDSKPFLSNGFLRSILYAISGRFFDLYLKQDELIKQSFVVTATGDNLVKFGRGKIIPLPPQKSIGNVSIGGSSGSVIPSGQILVAKNSEKYINLSDKTILDETININTIFSHLQKAVATTLDDHNIVDGDSVTISGASPNSLNGTYTAYAIDEKTFYYMIIDTADLTGSGTMKANITRAILDIESQNKSKDVNIDGLEEIELYGTLAGVNPSGFVTFQGVLGGKDLEDEEHYRKRVLRFLSEPVAPFNANNIRQLVLDNNQDLDQCFVLQAYPNSGEATIIPTSNGLDLPSAKLDKIKNEILTIKPAVVRENHIFVKNPTWVTIDITFLTTHSGTMQQAIRSNLEEYFKNEAKLGQLITVNTVNSVIYNTKDLEAEVYIGDFATDFNNNVVLGTEEMARLGQVIF